MENYTFDTLLSQRIPDGFNLYAFSRVTGLHKWDSSYTGGCCDHCEPVYMQEKTFLALISSTRADAGQLAAVDSNESPDARIGRAGVSPEPCEEHPHTTALRWLAESANPDKLTGAFAVEHARRALGLSPTKGDKQ